MNELKKNILKKSKMEHQDWEVVTLRNPKVAKANAPKEIVDKRSDEEKALSRKLAKLENESDVVKVDYIPNALAKEIQQKRCEKKETQKDLAKKLCVQPTVISDIESGKAIYNQETKKVIQKIQKEWGVKFVNK